MHYSLKKKKKLMSGDTESKMHELTVCCAKKKKKRIKCITVNNPSIHQGHISCYIHQMFFLVGDVINVHGGLKWHLSIYSYFPWHVLTLL